MTTVITNLKHQLAILEKIRKEAEALIFEVLERYYGILENMQTPDIYYTDGIDIPLENFLHVDFNVEIKGKDYFPQIMVGNDDTKKLKISFSFGATYAPLSEAEFFKKLYIAFAADRGDSEVEKSKKLQ